MRYLLIGTAALALAACTNTTGPDDVASSSVVLNDSGVVVNTAAGTLPPSGGVTAALRTADGKDVGTVTASVASDGITLTADGRMLPAGPHGIHIHAIGKCDGPAFTTAGPHWNPGMKMHGRDNAMGPHEGDLPNLEIGAGGTGTVTFTIKGATLAGLMDADGAAFVVHAKADDYRTDPSGNSGDRIACGVFTSG